MNLFKNTVLTILLSSTLISSYSYAKIVDDLTANYNNVAINCGSSRKPAFLCSGVLIRATSYSPRYNMWDPSPGSISRGGVSFSYIRKDVKLNRLVHDKDSGVIFYPSLLRPAEKDEIEALCSFPIDGWTDGRQGKGGCEAHYNYLADSGNCQGQGILTADAWIKHFNAISDGNKNQHQCGFKVSIGTSGSAAIFLESLKSQNSLYSGEVATQQNEIILSTWATSGGWPGLPAESIHPERLPIQAFFYTTPNGLKDARSYQLSYYNQYEIAIPVVKVTFPNNKTEDVKFSFNKDDQEMKRVCIYQDPPQFPLIGDCWYEPIYYES